MFDIFPTNRVASRDAATSDTGIGGRARFVEGDAPASNPYFGAIASYQVCGCCGVYRGPADGTDGGGQGVILNGDDRGGVGGNGKPSLLTVDAGTQISRTGQSWSTALGTGAVVSYAFRASAATMPDGTSGFSQLNASQITAAQLAFAAWSDVANITFNRVTDAGSDYSNNATILLGNYSSGQSGAAAFAYLPGGRPGATASTAVQGDVWINSSLAYNAAPVQQNYGQLTMLHEIGHAIGLSHPAAYNASASGSITYGANATYFEDSLQYSVMSYFSERETGANYRVNGTGNTRYASIPQLDDIAAAQRLYGANTTTRTGDTTYGFNSNAGQVWFSATSASSALIFAVWDAGGVDTFDFSGYSSNSTIDLRQAAFSSVGGMVGNVSIALGAVIENAIGGTGADIIRGNSGNNRITGGGGNDTIDGGLGSDTVVFSGVRSAYSIVWNGQVATVTGPGGTVTVSNVEFLAFSDQTIAATPSGGLSVTGDITNETIAGTAFADVIGGLGGSDTIDGLAGNDRLDGGFGNDVLNGGEGDDVLLGGLGNDALNGGAGLDTADYSGATGSVMVSLVTGAASGGSGTDTLTSIENITGSSFADIIAGDDNANVINGGGGIDSLNGGGGDDQLQAGAPGLSSTAADIIKAAGTANSTISTAVSVAGGFDRLPDDDIVDATTVPHATVVATTHGGVEYYAVTVQAGDVVVFDIDNASFDSTLRLFDATGTELAKNDDAAADGGIQTDSSLTYTFATAGTYYIQVAEWDENVGGTFTSQAPDAGGTYALHISVPSAPFAPTLSIGSTLNGDAGADRLTGGFGDDTLNGGTGNDTLAGAGGTDTIDGGVGVDTAVYAGNRADYTITSENGVTTITTVGQAEGTDRLTNVERLQFADGLRDINGNIVTEGGPINGTAGDDVLTGTTGADTINGGAGDDVITGAAGNDTIDGGDGTDTAVFSGTILTSTISTANGITSVTGPDGTDTLSNVERLRFSDGTLIVGAGGGQYFEGTSEPDIISGTNFSDQIMSGGGDDSIFGQLGDDTIDGGDGVDTVVLSGARDEYELATVNGVTTVTGSDGVDTLSNIEILQFDDGYFTTSGEVIVNYVTGTDAGETLTGGLGVDEINGGAGDDVINGYGGADFINGGAGSDFIDGGAGDDTLTLALPAASYFFQAVEGGWKIYDGVQDVDTVINIERVQFGGGEVVSIAEAATMSFDANRYMAGYSDLLAIFRNSPDGAYRHFVSTGMAEGRSANNFDALRYIASNPELISVLGINERLASEHYVNVGSIDGLSATNFDPLIYAASNRDLAMIFRSDSSALTLHYITSGYDEGRITDAFDPLIYLASNQGLAQTIGLDSYAGVMHYIMTGVDEGRPTSGFDPRLYLASHTDLLAVFGNNPTQALNQYLISGADEGRAVSGFDALRYIASNLDLALTFGANASIGLEHFLIAGLPEGRPTTTFDPFIYIASHADLTSVFGANATAGLQHYLATGASEGRETAAFDPRAYAAANTDLAIVFGSDDAALVQHYLATGFQEGRPTTGFDAVAYLLSNADLANFSAAQAMEHWLVAGAREGRAGDSLFGREQAEDHSLQGSRAGQIDGTGDRDWFQFSASAGGSYNILLGGTGSGTGTLQDGLLTIYDERGNILATNDNAGPGGDALLNFTVPSSGIYYVVVESADQGTGTYQISIAIEPSASRDLQKAHENHEPLVQPDLLGLEHGDVGSTPVVWPGLIDDEFVSYDSKPDGTVPLVQPVETDSVGTNVYDAVLGGEFFSETGLNVSGSDMSFWSGVDSFDYMTRQGLDEHLNRSDHATQLIVISDPWN